jgi:hypothetical protein
MSKDFKCEVCRKPTPSLHMRDLDGKWVCAHCIPEKELDACPGLRERLGLLRPRSGGASVQRKKAA